MNFNKSLGFFLGVAVTLLLSSCGSSDKKKSESQEFKDAQESLQSTIAEVVYNIPSPTEIPYLIQQTGAEFNASLLNPRTNIDRYTSRTEKAALNLGAYTADIGYLTSYDKTQEAIAYLEACKLLADNLGVIGSFDLELLEKFEANIGNKDSLGALLDRTQKQTERFLKDDARNRLAALVVTGSFIEGLYISTGLVQSYPKDVLPANIREQILTPVIQVILNQKKSVSELLKMLSALEQTDPVAELVRELQALESTYAAMDIDEQIKNNRGDLVLSDKNLTQISEIVAKMRKAITG
ncbi:MAG: hypothetical protein MUE95_08450 [Cyclobacteriaceae bacterium]|nr:hypothetical protein [Cyclobacteriaceae bacterium]